MKHYLRTYDVDLNEEITVGDEEGYSLFELAEREALDLSDRYEAGVCIESRDHNGDLVELSLAKNHEIINSEQMEEVTQRFFNFQTNVLDMLCKSVHLN